MRKFVFLILLSLLLLIFIQGYKGKFSEIIRKEEIIPSYQRIPSFNLNELGKNIVSRNIFEKLENGVSLSFGEFSILVKAEGDYLRLRAVNKDGTQHFYYLFPNINESRYITLVDSEGNVKNLNLLELVKEDEGTSINRVLVSKMQRSYKDKVESVLYDENYLRKKGYATKEGKIPVIISLNTQTIVAEKKVEKNFFKQVLLSLLRGIEKLLMILGFKVPSQEVEELGLTPELKSEKPIEAFEKAKSEVISILQEKRLGTESKIKRELRLINAISAEIPREKLYELKESPYVKKVSLDRKVRVLLDKSVPFVNATQVWLLKDDLGRNVTGKNITIAIIDTGIDYTHPDLGNCTQTEFLNGDCKKVIGGYDFVNNDPDPMDDHGHGTHCAGIAAGNGVLKGVAPDAKLMAIKVLDSYGSGYFSDVIAGIEKAVDPNGDGDYSDHVDVISMSLGGPGNPEDELSQAVDAAVRNGVVVVAAAGNSGPYSGTVSSPGCARKALTVGAMCRPEQVGTENYCESLIAEFSSRGPTSTGEIKPDLVAPGVKICSSQWDDVWKEYQCIDDEHTAISGTSQATPHVAGAAALLKQAHPDWSPEDIKSALMSTAQDLGFGVNTQGTGKIDIYKAVNAVISTYPQSVSFGRIFDNITNLTQEITIKNLKPFSIFLTLNTSLIEDERGNRYSLASLNVTEMNISPYSDEGVLLTINLSKDLGGTFEGEVVINDTYRIPFYFVKLSKLTITVKGDRPLYPYIYIHDDSINFSAYADQGWDFQGDTFTFFVPPGNYSIYAISSFEDPIEYILMDRVEVPPSSQINTTLKISDARPFTIKARALDGSKLKLYEWVKGFNTYNEEKVFSVSFHDPSYGDRIVYISNKPQSPLDTDIVFRYYGVPER